MFEEIALCEYGRHTLETNLYLTANLAAGYDAARHAKHALTLAAEFEMLHRTGSHAAADAALDRYTAYCERIGYDPMQQHAPAPQPTPASPLELATYEDIEAFFAAEGWGCKCCGQLSSPSWWKASGDTYCDTCKKAMWNELRVRFTRVPNRGPGQAPAVWEHDPSRFGHEYARDVRRAHADLMATAN